MQWYIDNQYGAQSFNIILRDQDEYFARYLMNFDSVYEWSRNGKRYSVTASLIGVFVLRLPEPAPITTAPHVFTFDETSGDYQDSGTSSNPFSLTRSVFVAGTSLRKDGAGNSAYSGINNTSTVGSALAPFVLGDEWTIEAIIRPDDQSVRGGDNGSRAFSLFQTTAKTGSSSSSTIHGAFYLGFANFIAFGQPTVPMVALQNPISTPVDNITEFNQALVPNSFIQSSAVTFTKTYHLLATFRADTRELSFYDDGGLVGTNVIAQADYDEWRVPSFYVEDPADVDISNPNRIKRLAIGAGAARIEGATRSPQDGAIDQLMLHEVHMDANQAALQASIANLP
jgi:hypothetical protein